MAQDLRGARDAEPVLERIRQFAPTNEDFQREFGTAQVKHRATARYLLNALELARRTGETVVAGPSQVHVEHIYPQSPPSARRLDDHEALVHRLGNLTLLARPLNQSIKNAPFVEKKQAYASSELGLAIELLDFDDWNAETIDSRQQRMSQIAPSIWAL